MKKQKGITLIALVITIIVLLILAGVTISMIVGDNGILTRTDSAAENTRGGKVEEAKVLWQNEKKLAKYDEDPNIKVETQDELLERLVKEGSLTEKEKKEIEEKGQVTIGNKTIVFEKDNSNNNLYTVIYTDGVKGDIVFPEQCYEELKEGDATPAFVGTPNRKNEILADDADDDGNIYYVAVWQKDDNLYQVKYTDGLDGAVFGDETHGSLRYGQTTPKCNSNIFRQEYTFIGWSPEFSDIVQGNATYVAQWKKN